MLNVCPRFVLVVLIVVVQIYTFRRKKNCETGRALISLDDLKQEIFQHDHSKNFQFCKYHGYTVLYTPYVDHWQNVAQAVNVCSQ